MTKLKSYTKRIVSLMIAIMIATGCMLYQPQQVQAGQGGLSSEYISAAEEMCYNNLVLDLAMGAYAWSMKPGKTKVFDFAHKASARRYVIKYAGATLPYGVSEEEANRNKDGLNKTSKLLFGKTTPGAKVVAMDPYSDYQPKIECLGPDIQIKKVGSKYVVEGDLWSYDVVYSVDTKLLGTVTFVMKKNPSSDAKWKITKIKLKRL